MIEPFRVLNRSSIHPYVEDRAPGSLMPFASQILEGRANNTQGNPLREHRAIPDPRPI
jgi:hypothetical protein